MSWILLIVAGLLEACWVVGLKYTDGFSKLFPSLVVGSAIAGSMVLLAIAVRNLLIGIAYAVWVSIGVVGAVIAQPLLFRPSATAWPNCIPLPIADFNSGVEGDILA